ncbi:hypothetical protein SD70_32280 [Gordoniibacillus kamchatkensis]|uniref:G5 domain-containing protein n=1 Tax=Gordoniibacillus kamchatkensis TaxID=1590651 RepID=A0ABR5A2D5_9BACL|nr:VanW family protein [Paenibacillus sp. VKM B-2647]KIL35209.1 hypothetical protein SD70_32280 [Paenibacillus sp. VKM B-2647]
MRGSFFAAVLGLLLLVMGGLFWYASQQRLPAGLTVSGWHVGGMPFTAFDAALDARIAALGRTPVQLRTSAYGLPPLQTTYAQLGVQASAAELRRQLDGLRRGTPWERAGERWRLRHASLELRVTLPPADLAAALRAAWKPLFEAKPVDAQRVITPDDRVTYVAEQTVPRIDAAKLAEALLAAAPKIASLAGERGAGVAIADVPLVQEAPRVTVASLRAEGIERKIAQFTTEYVVSSAGRRHNIESTAATVQDMMLKPGDVFDYAKVIENTQKTFGYQEAPVILDGKIVPGVGGGICQVSTTLYNAVLRSGLEIVERRNHSLPISYVPLGQDATFSTGYINFRFRNNTGYGLLIRTVAANGMLTVKLFGRLPEDISYDIDSKIVKTIEPPVKYVKNSSLRRGEQRKVLDGKRGFVVETTRIKRQNGKIIGTELISRDTYSPQPTVIAINSGADAGDGEGTELPAPHVEDGIAGPKFR